MRNEAGYKKLTVWKKSDELAMHVYALTKTFPKEEQFGLTSQIRRAGVSVPTNIVEGYGRNSPAQVKTIYKYYFGISGRSKIFIVSWVQTWLFE